MMVSSDHYESCFQINHDVVSDLWGLTVGYNKYNVGHHDSRSSGPKHVWSWDETIPATMVTHIIQICIHQVVNQVKRY